MIISDTPGLMANGKKVIAMTKGPVPFFSDNALFENEVPVLPMPYVRFSSGSTQSPVYPTVIPGISQTLTGQSVAISGYTDGAGTGYQTYFNTGKPWVLNSRILQADILLTSTVTSSFQLGVGFGANMNTPISQLQVAQNGTLVRGPQAGVAGFVGANAALALTVGSRLRIFIERININTVTIYCAVGANSSAKYSFTNVDLSGNIFITMRGSVNITVTLSASGFLRIGRAPGVYGADWKIDNTVLPYENEAYTVVADTDLVNGSAVNGYISGNTGLSMDPVTRRLLIACYNYATTSRIFDQKISELIPYSPVGTITPNPSRIINVTAFLDHIQGVAYDFEEGFIYAFGTIKGANSAQNGNRVIICVNKNGEKVKSDYFPAVAGEAGMIVVYEKRLYIKFNNIVTLYIYDLVSKSLIDSFTTNGAWEGLTVCSYGIFVCGTSGASAVTLYSHEPGHAILWSGANPVLGGEIEGMVFDEGTRGLIIQGDAHLHGGNPNGNMAKVVNPFGRYKQDIRFPQLFGWNTWKFTGKLVPMNGALFGWGAGISPVIFMNGKTDFIGNAPVLDVVGRTVSLEYRGSNIAPTTAQLTDEFVKINLDWGITVPGAWQSTPPALNYIQVRMTVS